MKKKSKNYTTEDGLFLLLVQFPNKKVHQVLIPQIEIQRMISSTKEFTVIEEPLKGITFKLIK